VTRFPFALLLIILALTGCQPKRPPATIEPAKIDYAAPLPEGEMALKQITPAEYPDFSAGLLSGDLDGLKRSLDNSLKYFARPSSAKAYPYLNISHERAVATLRAFRQLLDQMSPGANSQQLNATIAEKFDVYASVGAPSPSGGGYTRQVLFTGYYTPTFDASLTRSGAYQFPLYKRPADLITDETGERAGRKQDATIVPYYTRQDIENGHMLDGQEIAWLTTRWNAYVVTVQGSGRLRLPDGRIFEVGYAGTNGYPYTSPGRQMVKDGAIPEGQLSFDSMRNYFQANPPAMDKYLWLNQRTTFFTETRGGPFGAINVPVTAFSSIATDKSVYPAGMLAFVNAPTSYAGKNLAGRFMMDQDRGGAIRSAGRCDIYMGVGDGAEQMSGRQLSPGKLYYLAIKQDHVAEFTQ
jgi:membrane-bound lytic murein transglycosylase A